MNVKDPAHGARPLVLGVLGAGWLIGLLVQVWTRLATGYMDVFPPQLLLGAALCLGAGVAARAIDPVRRSVRWGALAGLAMAAAIVVGYLILSVVLWNPIWAGESGETWFSFLLEAWFWIGVPLVVSAGLGAAGWLLADRAIGTRGTGTSVPRP